MNYELLLKDFNYPIKYMCPVCNTVGLAFRHNDERKKIPWNICHTCGYVCGFKRSYRDERKWLASWKENGSIRIYDLPLNERCDAYIKIQNTYYKKKYVILSKEQIQNKDLDEKVFTQHGLKKVKREKKLVIDCDGKKTLLMNYETNVLFYIYTNEGYITLIEDHKTPLLLVSDFFSCSGEDVSNPIRQSYIGLIPDLFYGAYMIDDICVLRDNIGHIYKIRIQ